MVKLDFEPAQVIQYPGAPKWYAQKEGLPSVWSAPRRPALAFTCHLGDGNPEHLVSKGKVLGTHAAPWRETYQAQGFAICR
jgi:hypothetical protein